MVDEYDSALLAFRAIIESIPGRIALTLDGWSSRVMRGYMVVTMHWIDTEWNLRSAILEFKHFPPPHNQITTTDFVCSVLKDFNVHTRVRAITSDSGVEMPPAMDRVRCYLNESWSLHLNDANDFYIRCVCHFINRAVVDASELVKKEVDMLRVIVKTIRSSALLRNKYSELSVVLGRTVKQTPPSLDVETRWATKFLMMEECFKNKNIIEVLCNCEEFKDQMMPLKLTDIEWRVVKASKDFLETAYQCTNAASGSKYATIGMQPLVYGHLKKLCEQTIAGQSSTGFTTPVVKAAAQAMLTKLEKYEPIVNSKSMISAS